MEYELLSKIFYKNKELYEKKYNERFNDEITKKLPIKIKGYQAFYVQCPQIFQYIIRIQSMDKQIKVLSDNLPGVALSQFANRSLVDEIMITNSIEGVHSTRREIYDTLEAINQTKKRNRFYGLVKKYIMLSKDTIPMNECKDIRAIYDELVLPEVIEEDESNYPDGVIFRKESVSVNSATQKELHRGMYPESEIILTMERALEILNDETIELLIRVAVFHYLFGYIHPFYEGNGRTSRFISSYLLSNEYEPLIGYRISYTIKDNISKYYEAFKICNDEKNRGDITPFVIMFLDIIEVSFQQLHYALQKRLDKFDYYSECISKLPYAKDTKTEKIYNYLIQAGLFSENGISTKELLELMEISRNTLDGRIKRIKEDGLLKVICLHGINYYSLDIEKLDEYLSLKT